MFDVWFWLLCAYAVACIVVYVVLFKKYQKSR